MTSSETPMSAAIAVHSEACPESVRHTKTAFTANDRTMLVRMIASMRRECLNNQGNFERSPVITAMSAASMTVSLTVPANTAGSFVTATLHQ